MLRRSDGDASKSFVWDLTGRVWLAGLLACLFLLFFVIPPRNIQDLENGLDLRVENGDVCLVHNGDLALLDRDSCKTWLR